MTSSVINKVITIHNMNLPYELCEHIISFCFYDEYQAKLKNIKKILNKQISSSFSGNENNGDWWQWWFEAGVYYESSEKHETQFQAGNCIRCGNYTRGNNFALAANNSICICNDFHYQDMDLTFYPSNYEQLQEGLLDGLYWIDNEINIDPIETSYAEWREEYFDSQR